MAEIDVAHPTHAPDANRQAVRVIADDAQAIAVAHELAGRLAQDAAERDRERRLPHDEIEWFSQSGLWAITVPKAYGGAGVSFVTLVEVVRIIAAADPSLGQLPQNHFGLVDVIALTGTEDQKRHFFAEILKASASATASRRRARKTCST